MGHFFNMHSSKKINQFNWPHIPQNLLKLYNNNSKKNKIYLKLRWRLCPFYKIINYIPKSGNILDIGCGFGILSNILALESSQRIVKGIDISESRIIESKKTIRERKNIQFLIQDIKDIDYKIYDTIIMSDFLHHLDNVRQTNILKTIYDKLNKESRLIILDVNKTNSIKYYFANIVDFILNGKKSNFRSNLEWESVLKDIGFTIENVVDLSKGLPLSDFLIIAKK